MFTSLPAADPDADCDPEPDPEPNSEAELDADWDPEPEPEADPTAEPEADPPFSPPSSPVESGPRPHPATDAAHNTNTAAKMVIRMVNIRSLPRALMEILIIICNNSEGKVMCGGRSSQVKRRGL